MRIIRDFSACPPDAKNAAVALGNFDGVHLGHQEILRSCIATAKQSGAPSAVMTFEPHPREFFTPGSPKLRIYPFRRKVELLRDMGIDILFLVRFNRRFASMAAENFVKDILHRDLNARHVVTGYNFAFGKGRGGNAAYLGHMAEILGFGFSACPPVNDATHTVISSSAIRDRLAEGDVRKASVLLGRTYDITGHVQHGEKRGRVLGFPTANISLDSLFKPHFGIYAARVKIGDEEGWHDGVASLGIRPTFGHSEPLLEVYLFGMDRGLYGKTLCVRFLDYLRDEKRFDNEEALKIQMAADCQKAKDLLQHARQ